MAGSYLQMVTTDLLQLLHSSLHQQCDESYQMPEDSSALGEEDGVVVRYQHFSSWQFVLRSLVIGYRMQILFWIFADCLGDKWADWKNAETVR